MQHMFVRLTGVSVSISGTPQAANAGPVGRPEYGKLCVKIHSKFRALSIKKQKNKPTAGFVEAKTGGVYTDGTKVECNRSFLVSLQYY